MGVSVMKLKTVAASLAAFSMVVPAGAAFAGKKDDYVVVNEEVGVPVFPYDLTDRPYVVVGPVKAGVRKATIFSKEPSQKKIYNELWERGEKMDADAVVNATYGDSHMTAFSWGKTNALGFAVRFLTQAEIESGMTGETAPSPEEYTEDMFDKANKKRS